MTESSQESLFLRLGGAVALVVIFIAAVAGIIKFSDAWSYSVGTIYVVAILAMLAGLVAVLRRLLKNVHYHVATHASLSRALGRVPSEQLQETAAAVAQILASHHFLRGTCDAILVVPVGCRESYGGGMAVAAAAWAHTLAVAGRDETGAGADLLTSVFHRYMKEEARDITGEAYEGRRVVVTNFVAYAALVKALVDATAQRFVNEHVVCFTTLAMPLPRWFNYIEWRAVDNPEGLKHTATDKRWVAYTEEVRTLVHQRASFTLLRHLLCLSSSGKYRHGVEPRLAITNTEDDLRTQSGYHLLVPKAGDPIPFDSDDLVSKFNMTGLDASAYTGSNLAYLIASELPSAAQDFAKYRWMPLWQAFALGYHRHIPNCRVNVLKDTDADDWLLRDDSKAMPEDFFAVGIGPADRISEVKWLACLGADTNVAMDLVSLELMTPTLSPDRFGTLRDYIQWLSSKGMGIDQWIDERPRGEA